MHDLRAAAPRWSKTAVVVVFVVFGLVLVVGIFGLWAFRASRESSLQTARADALVHTKTELDKIESEIGNHLSGLLIRAEGIATDTGTDPDSLRQTENLKKFLSGQLHGRTAREVFRVGPDATDRANAVFWFDGRYRMVDSLEAIEAEASESEKRAEELATLKSLAWTTKQKSGPKAALGYWRDIVSSFGLVTSSDGGASTGRNADGVQFAAEMLKQAAMALEEDAGAVRVGEARALILMALEVESLNQERQGLDPAYVELGLASIEREIEAILTRLPTSAAATLRWEIHRFRHTRTQVKRLIENGVLLGAIDDVRKADKLGKFVRFEGLDEFETSELLGIDFGGAREYLVVRFDLLAVEDVVQEKMDEHERKFQSYGMASHLLRQGEDPNLPGGRREVAELTLADRTFELPFRIVVDRVGNPEGHGEDFTDVMFWVVIGLAVAGLIMAGRILVRLLTREVRLAQLKADFVSNLSHELKTPITSIALFTEMLEDGKITDPEDLGEAYSVLSQESTRLQGLVHRMIDVARGEARKTPYELIPGDLNRPVLEAATRLRRIVTEPGLDLKIHLHPAPLPMLMDLSSMDDVVTNLLSNAWKYKRGDSAKIVVRTTRRGRWAVLEVSDDGIGIPKGERRRVFEMFYRAEQYLTHPVSGTGLGLALVRSVVAGHKGRVRVEAGPGGVGTTFRLRFPLARGMEAEMVSGDTAEIDGAINPPVEDAETAAHGTQTAAGHGKVAITEPEATQETGLSDRQIETGASNPGAQQ